MRKFRADILVSLVLAGAALVLFAPACAGDFTNYDDPDYVTQNPHVRTGLRLANVGWAFSATHSANWHPLTWLSLQLDATLFGVKPWAFHLTNVLLHAANSVLLFVAFRLLTGALWRSALVAALFALHPLHVESVAWVAERKDVLSTFFWIATMIGYAWYVRRPGPGRYAVVCLTFALGLMAKPMLVTLPCVLLLLDYWPLERLQQPENRAWERPGPASQGKIAAACPRVSRTVAVLEKVPLALLVIASCAITLQAQRQARTPLLHLSLSERAANALIAYVIYVRKMVWPSDLAVYYPFFRGSLSVAAAAGAGLVLVGLSFIFLVLLRRQRYAAVGWLWYLGTLVPVIGLVQVGCQKMADRYTYVPLIGLFLIVAWGGASLAERLRLSKRVLSAAAATVCFACLLVSWQQVGYWHDSRTLWSHALEVAPPNPVSCDSMGTLLMYQGRSQQAVPYFEKGLQVFPEDEQLHFKLGLALAGLGRHDEALNHYRAALVIQPDLWPAHAELGGELLERGQPVAAEAEFREALRGQPQASRTHNLLGIALARQGRLDEAVRCYAEAVRRDAGCVQAYHNWGVALARQGKLQEAVALYREALRLDPGYASARANLAVALDHLSRLNQRAPEGNGKSQAADVPFRP